MSVRIWCLIFSIKIYNKCYFYCSLILYCICVMVRILNKWMFRYLGVCIGRLEIYVSCIIILKCVK